MLVERMLPAAYNRLVTIRDNASLIDAATLLCNLNSDFVVVCGRDYARRLKRKRASRRDIWHLDEVVITIGGEQHGLWRRSISEDISSIVQTRWTPRQQSVCYPSPRSRLSAAMFPTAGSAAWRQSARDRRRCTRASTTGRELSPAYATTERAMQGFRSPAGCSGSSPSSPPSAISSSRRSALATHLHRLNAVAQWKSVAGITPKSVRAPEIASPRPGQLM